MLYFLHLLKVDGTSTGWAVRSCWAQCWGAKDHGKENRRWNRRTKSVSIVKKRVSNLCTYMYLSSECFQWEYIAYKLVCTKPFSESWGKRIVFWPKLRKKLLKNAWILPALWVQIKFYVLSIDPFHKTLFV